MPNGHIRIDLITDIEKDTDEAPGNFNQKRFSELDAADRKLFTDRFAEVITPSDQAIEDYAELMTRPWFDAKVKAEVGAMPSNAQVQDWFTMAINQYKAEVTGAAPIILDGDTPSCVRIVIINGIPEVVYNQGLTLSDDAAPLKFRDGHAPEEDVIFASFHIMLIYTGPDRDSDADLDPVPLPASGPSD